MSNEILQAYTTDQLNDLVEQYRAELSNEDYSITHRKVSELTAKTLASVLDELHTRALEDQGYTALCDDITNTRALISNGSDEHLFSIIGSSLDDRALSPLERRIILDEIHTRALAEFAAVCTANKTYTLTRGELEDLSLDALLAVLNCVDTGAFASATGWTKATLMDELHSRVLRMDRMRSLPNLQAVHGGGVVHAPNPIAGEIPLCRYNRGNRRTRWVTTSAPVTCRNCGPGLVTRPTVKDVPSVPLPGQPGYDADLHSPATMDGYGNDF